MRTTLLLCTAAALRQNSKATPVEKVTDLLELLKEKTVADGRKEEVLFAKFTDFCRSHEDEKFWLSAKGAKKINGLEMDIEEHTALIEKREQEIEGLKTEVEENRGNIETDREAMNEKSKEDAQSIADLDEVIRQCKEALTHLRNGDRSGTRFLQGAGDQDKEFPVHLLNAIVGFPRIAGTESAKKLVALSQGPAGEPRAYQFHSTEVLGLLEELVTEFKNERLAKDQEAMQTRQESEKSILTMKNLVQSLSNQEKEKQKEAEENKVQKADKEAAMELLKKNLDANNEFASHLVGCAQLKERSNTEGQEKLSAYLADNCPPDATELGECGDKKNVFEQRQKTRTEEVAAIEQAIKLLRGDAGSKYSANKRLVGLVTSHVKGKTQKIKTSLPPRTREDDLDDAEWHAAARENGKRIFKPHQEAWIAADDDEDDETSDFDDDEPTAFIQLSREVSKAKLLKFLSQRASTLKSRDLSALLMKVEMAKGDHFKDVVDLINKLIERLEKQLADESEQKEWCDTEMKANEEARAKAKDDTEEASSNIDAEKAKESLLQTEIVELQAQIAKDVAMRKDQEEIRVSERAQNKQTVEDAEAGLAAIKDAIDVLSKFYEGQGGGGGAFLQTSEPKSELYRAAGAEQGGKTIADLRPESDVFEEEYGGNQGESKGIIGLLEIVQADYERTVETVGKTEDEAESEWKDSDAKVGESITGAEETVKTKKDEKSAAEEAIVEHEGLFADASAELKSRNEELAQLKPLCSSTAAADQLEERRKRRDQEIASLREALAILREA